MKKYLVVLPLLGMLVAPARLVARVTRTTDVLDAPAKVAPTPKKSQSKKAAKVATHKQATKKQAPKKTKADEWSRLKAKASHAAKVVEDSVEGTWDKISKDADRWSEDLLGDLKEVDVASNEVNSAHANIQLGAKVVEHTHKNVSELKPSDHPDIKKVQRMCRDAERSHEAAKKTVSDIKTKMKNVVENARDRARDLAKQANKHKSITKADGQRCVEVTHKIAKDLHGQASM